MPLFMFIKKDSFKAWELDMNLHNQILRRGGPFETINSKIFECSSLDQYMLQMHASRLAQVIDAYTAFAARVLPWIQKNPEAQSWWVNEHLLVQRHHWTIFSCRVMTLLKASGFENGAFQPTSTQSADRWPNLDQLHESARRASRIFGAFGAAEDAWSSIAPPPRRTRAHPFEQQQQQGSGKRRRAASPISTLL
jgi:hypothetical protein